MSVEEITSERKAQIRFRNKHIRQLKDLVRTSHFNPIEIDELIMIYFKLKCENDAKIDYITRTQMRTILYKCFNMPEQNMIDRIFAGLDKGVTVYISLETWIHSLSLFLRGTLEEKIVFCFTVYDLFGDGIIARDHLLSLAKHFVIKHQEEDVEEAVKDFVNIILKKMDLDRDGALSFADYRDTVREFPELLECLGQCLPDRASVYAFLTTFTNKFAYF